MAQNWLVTFIDKGNCEIVTIQVNCYQAYRASKIAFKDLEKRDAALAETVKRETYSIKVEDA